MKQSVVRDVCLKGKNKREQRKRVQGCGQHRQTVDTWGGVAYIYIYIQLDPKP